MIWRNDPKVFEAKFDIVQTVGNEFTDALTDRAPVIFQRIKTEAQKAGVPDTYLSYLLWVIENQQDNWPSMDARAKSSLQIAFWIMHSGSTPGMPKTTPPYLKVPPSELEENVNKALLMIAQWCKGYMTEQLWMAYMTILQRNSKTLEKIMTDIPAGTGRFFLKSEFEYALSKTPSRFPRYFLLDQAISVLFA